MIDDMTHTPELPNPNHILSETIGVETAPPKTATTRSDLTAESLTRLTLPIAMRAGKEVTISDMNTMLETALHEDEDGNMLLFEQAQTLNAMFHRLLETSVGGTGCTTGKPLPFHLSEHYLILALKAQKQCALTVDVLSKTKARKAFCESDAPPPPEKNEQTN